MVGLVIYLRKQDIKPTTSLFHHFTIFRELAEWSIAAVLKTADCNRSGGSNPSLSTKIPVSALEMGFLLFRGTLRGIRAKKIHRGIDYDVCSVLFRLRVCPPVVPRS